MNILYNNIIRWNFTILLLLMITGTVSHGSNQIDDFLESSNNKVKSVTEGSKPALRLKKVASQQVYDGTEELKIDNQGHSFISKYNNKSKLSNEVY